MDLNLKVEVSAAENSSSNEAEKSSSTYSLDPQQVAKVDENARL
jgi:hypothetical protein